MSNHCTICKTETGSGLLLCNTHLTYLRNAFDEIPWLWQELQTTVTKTDRLNMGVTGRKSTDSPSPINWGASRLAGEVDIVLTRMVATLVAENGLRFMPSRKVPQGFIGPLLDGWERMDRPGYSGSVVQRAVWLRHHASVIAGREDVRDWYFQVINLTGDPDTPKAPPGKLVVEINKRTETWAGPCPTVVGYGRSGEPIECGEILYAYNGAEDAECGECRKADPPRSHIVNVKDNLNRALLAQDILTERHITEVMAGLGQPIYSDLIQRWLRDERLEVQGYLHHDRIVDKRLSARDSRLFSLKQVKQLRRQDRKQRGLAEVAS
ncbi:hypothetical protein FZI85_17375 [Mycobacterium sp. CBMA293]|nr:MULTISPECIES: hypothetical protein [unclassified Mycolicibacterium]MUL44494.1 hypothetical protein [Mycolicibacterium sp. CBMA 360]MUL59814.1 hypothetical protein [Mycolicibacterium sp. CBMA 335]MUL68657.1 hypothetical protein [Mycolicibacterium sp. CBMA 311]MUL93952.1 hypothetical protein [Mycolicibacterium sp. CBMA 230]MUM06198.1 hypothetical protein [Mycolicibacterium sp. CBMA 213]